MLSTGSIPEEDEYQKKGLVLGNVVEGLYQLFDTSSISALAVSHSTDLFLLHKRLGHIIATILSKIQSLCPITNIYMSCTTCPLSK